ncbi:MAG: chromate transporter [Paenibacillus sp.]|nr:chromate transporter [Paenibacillus sp.]
MNDVLKIHFEIKDNENHVYIPSFWMIIFYFSEKANIFISKWIKVVYNGTMDGMDRMGMTDMRSQLKRLWPIFWTFCRIAPITFGGGYAMIPVLEREAVHKRRWIKQEDVADVLAVSQTIPGAVALNAASFVGYRVAGVAGAVTAVIGMMIPTFLIVIGLAALLLTFRENAKVAAALQGMKPAVIAMIVFAGYRMARTALVDKATIAISLIAALLLLQTFVSPIAVIVIGAIAGIGIGSWKHKRGIDTAPVRRYTDPDYYIGDGI